MRNDRIILFTDGSHRRAGMGAGFLAHDGRRLAYGGSPVAATRAGSDVAEAYALDKGVRAVLAAFPGARSIDVVTDSDTTIRAVKGWIRPAPPTDGLLRRLDADLREARVSLAMHWTPAHLDEGTAYGFANAVVDRLASIGAHGRRVARILPYGPGWARAVRRSDPRLAGLPRYVGREVAAALIGIDPAFVGDLVANGHLQPAEVPGLVVARSLDRVRRHAASLGHPVPDPMAWSPGPLGAPTPPPEAVMAVAPFRAGETASVGAVLLVAGEEREMSAPATARGCAVAGGIDAVVAMLHRAAPDLRPLTPMRVLVADERLFRVIARLDPPGGRAAQLALGRLAAAADGARIRVAVTMAGDRPGRARNLMERAGRLALRAAGAPPERRGPDAGRDPARDPSPEPLSEPLPEPSPEPSPEPAYA